MSSELRDRRALHSFPTRRSSDLDPDDVQTLAARVGLRGVDQRVIAVVQGLTTAITRCDRKSTRLNSSHRRTSYAGFCLKKNKRTDEVRTPGVRSSTVPCAGPTES